MYFGVIWSREQVIEMHKRYENGATLRELGAEIGITYERVRQLFQKFDLPTGRADRGTVNRYESMFSAWEHEDQILESYKRIGTVTGTSGELGISEADVSTVLDSFAMRNSYTRKGSHHSYEQPQLEAALRTAAEQIGEPLTIPGYRKIAPELGLPADLTIIRSFGTWNAACASAGVKANPSQGKRSGSYIEQDCINSIRKCAEDLGKVPSYAAYNKWAKANEAPSGQTIRVKMSGWSDALLRSF